MEASLWIVSFMIFPYLNLGSLSDYKICGDPGCESPMSRVQAIKNHKGKDCRFLNFRRGDTIFVYHKLTGKREDLWAGTIDKQFGYFPNDAVEEEDVFATMRKVVETQKSDFFCMDESGYPIDTNHLDTDEDDDHNFQEPESIQITPHSHDTNAQDSFMSTESMVKEREDEDGNKDLIYAAKRVEDEPKTSASPEEQGGSPSSSWLRSSVTEWLGLAKEEQSGESEQGEREDEREETKSAASLTSSVTGWLGFGGEGQHDNDEDSVKIRKYSFTSSMTGWLGFGEEKKTITVENEEIEETGNEKDPTETFRSRRMSLNLEGSKLQEEEKEDMGTLGWLGSGLSSRLGFGSSAQDSGGEGEGVKEQPASSSWMEMRIGGIWGFGDSNTEADGSKGSVISETEKDQTLEQPSGSENVVISQAQASFSEEIKAQTEKKSEMKEIVNVLSTLQGSAESGDAIDHNIDNTDTKQVNILDINTEIEVFNKGVLIHNSSLKDNTGDNRPIENVGENNIRGQQFSQNDEFTEQHEISLDTDHSSKELDSNSMEQLEGSVEKDENHHIQTKAPGSLKEDGAEVTNQVHKLEESTLMSENSPVSGDDNKGKLFNEVTGLSQQEILKEESLEETQVSDDQEGSNEQGQVVFSSLETEILQGELGLQQETQPMETSSQDDGASLSGNTESLYDNVSEDDGGKISSNETTPGINKTPGFPHMENKVMQRESDADQFKETVKDQNERTEKEKSYFEEEAWDESELKLTVGSERETESPEGLKEDVTMMKKEEVKEVKELIKELKQEGQQRKLEDIHKNEIEKEEEMVNVSRDGRGLRKERQKEAEELEEGEKMETALLKNEQAKMIRLKESEEPNEKEQEEKMAEVSGESLSDKEMELIGEREKDAKKLNEKDKHVEELLEHGNQIRVEELKESEEQNEKEEKADVSGGKEVEMELKEERQKKIEELKEDTELPEHKQARVERLKESGEPNKKEQKEEKMGEVSGESLSDKEMEIRGEKQKDAKRLNEKDKHVEELLEHGNQIRVEGLKESEKQNKKEEKAEVSWEREETELQKEMEKEVEDQKDEENQETELLEHEQATLERLEESEEPNGKKKGGKEKKTGVFGESNKEEGKEFSEQEQREDDDSKEKTVKEFVKYENRVRVEELKAYEEQNKEEKKENEEQLQEGQLEDNKTDIWRPEFEDFEKESVDNSSLASLVPETNTEIQREEEETEVEKQKKNELDKEKEHMMKGVEVNNIVVGGSEDGEWTGKLNDEGNWKEDSDNSDFEEEIRKTDATKTGNEFHRDRGEDKTHHSAESQVQISEQTKSTHPPQGTQSESKGDLGLFKNTLGFFSQMPIPAMTESIQSVQNFQTNSPETSQPCGSFAPELDSSTDSLHPEATHTAFPPEQPQPHSISAKNLNYNAPSVTEAPSKTETLNKHYKNIHHHMNAGEVVILQDLFGRHKLQFLDYILTSLDAMTAEEDQSILSDIERLLQHHMEMLDAPSMSITDVPQEDKQRTSAISALQKLGTLLKTVKETISTGISDVSNHQAGHSSSQTKDEEDNSQPSSLREDDGGNVKDLNYVEEERRDTGSKDKMASLHHTQPGSQQKGLIKTTLEFIHRVADDSIIYAHAVMEILVWIIVQAQDFGKDFKISIQQ